MSDRNDSEKSMRENKEFWRIINLLNLALVFIVIYFLIQMQAQKLILSDVRDHIDTIQQYLDGTYFIPHPFWHLGTYALSKLLSINLDTAASVFTALLVTAYAVIIYLIAKDLDEFKENEAKWFLITFISMTIGPFFLASFNPFIYIGQGSPTIWHNVTLFAVKPFALLSVFFTIKFFLTNRFNYFILALIVTILSIFAKPNYIIVFLPSLVVYMLLKRYFDKRQLQFALVAILLSVAALAYQFLNQFGDKGESKIIIDFLGVWSLYTPNVAVSILLALGLPMLITLFNYRSIKENEYIKFTWLLVFFSLILFACFAEEGYFYRHGNFSWSLMITLSLIYIFTIIEYFKQYSAMPFIARYSLLAIILYQVYVGWYYLIGIFNGVAYGSRIDTFPLF
jgi:hypothetical protein